MLIPEKIQKSNPIKFNTKEIQESLQKQVFTKRTHLQLKYGWMQMNTQKIILKFQRMKI